jgi:hypothetical protein
MMYEHQLTEFRKHIAQLEIENQAYKQQVTEQTSEIELIKSTKGSTNAAESERDNIEQVQELYRKLSSAQ